MSKEEHAEFARELQAAAEALSMAAEPLPPERITRATVEAELARLAAAIGTPMRLVPGAGPGDGRRVRIETPWGRPIYDELPHTLAETHKMITFALLVVDHEHGPAFVAAQVDEYTRGYELSRCDRRRAQDVAESGQVLAEMLAHITETLRNHNSRGTFHHPERAFLVGRFDGLTTEQKP